MIRLTSHERLMRIFRGEKIDRPALKLWGAGPAVGWQLHEAYRPVSLLAAEITDLFAGARGFWVDPMFGADGGSMIESRKAETGDPLWLDCHTVLHTPKGDMEKVYRQSQIGDPGYTMEYYVKEAEDIEKLLSVPYTAPTGMRKEFYDEAVSAVGERGIAMIDLPHAAYFAHQMMGSETLAYLSVDARELVDELISVFARRIRDQVKRILETGVEHPVFSWCGPEKREVYLCPSAGYMEYARPTELYIDNLLFYLRYGLEAAERCGI